MWGSSPFSGISRSVDTHALTLSAKSNNKSHIQSTLLFRLTIDLSLDVDIEVFRYISDQFHAANVSNTLRSSVPCQFRASRTSWHLPTAFRWSDLTGIST